MDGIADLLKSVAPGIATALGGPLAGAAVAFLSKKFGVPADQLAQTIAGMTPADLVRMKELDNDFEKFKLSNAQALNLAQIEVNKTEAASASFWVSGWRPAAGWVCVAALALTYIPKAFVLSAFWAYQSYLILTNPAVILPTLAPFPDLGVTDLIGLLMALLGMAGLRSFDKRQSGG